MIKIPDLLHSEPRHSVDQENVFELLDMAFLGRDTGNAIDKAMTHVGAGNGWDHRLFAKDLFLDDLVRDLFTIRLGGLELPVNHGFLLSVLGDPPSDMETIRFRQEILKELTENDTLRRNTEQLYLLLSRLFTMLKVPDHVARLDINAHRMEIFIQVKEVLDQMVANFADAGSGLRRLHDSGLEIQASEEYSYVASLLDYDQRFLSLNVDLSLGADGRVRELNIRQLAENTENRFYRGPWKRFVDRLKLLVWHGTLLSNREVVNRLLHQVFTRFAPSLATLVTLIGHLELYLAGLTFRQKCLAKGLEVSLPTFPEKAPLHLRQAFNPLLLQQATPPVPADVGRRGHHGVTLITGPNSGGKTRLLQTLGLVQVLGQSGLYVPAAEAELPLLSGMFVSVIESEASDAAEGRLGREMMRIRSLFEGLKPPAMVILDELCSGTNPSEGIEMFSLVLRLLDRLGSVTFISTHFLDYAQSLEKEAPVPGLEFLNVEIDPEQRSTYQFIEGVATTSLAAVTGERLGVTFEQLSELIDRQLAESEAVAQN
jgi:DNA mismatch repair protein MutS2